MPLRLARALLVGGALLALPRLGFAQDVLAGRKVASGICQACHGLDGLAKVPEVPNLAGMDAAYVTKQLAAFKAGTRQNETMNAVASMLDDTKMADVAAYFAAIPVSVGPLPGAK